VEGVQAQANGVSCGYRNFSSVAVLVQPADCDSSIVSLIFENRRAQRDNAMLFYFLVPWILVTLFMASPLPDILRGRNTGAGIR
jgi:hypothetical protein